jgi:hypothetical protein
MRSSSSSRGHTPVGVNPASHGLVNGMRRLCQVRTARSMPHHDEIDLNLYAMTRPTTESKGRWQ